MPKPAPQEQQKPNKRQTVNLDTGTLIAATSLQRPWVAIGIHAYLADKHVVATQAALSELTRGLNNYPGPVETILVGLFLLRVDPIADNPSGRVMNLSDPSGNKRVDKIVFGTGDRLGITTLTGDERFKKYAKSQGVTLDIVVHPFGRHAGK